ncbi:hypothetical protein G7068_05560 [Leucobacter viscericola]|uniref:Uncharacterized protein n=1 Tax=Leucobacter viscericola TaxID=2714935 RepID=A0A6G7XDP2_9MICO|nr:carboxypeptidase regulatory-like domain-containing protein [Leucobacter viscericola]QIK62730.1 hypothetical protein G7068_05560 [Leucobacter viscericola]
MKSLGRRWSALLAVTGLVLSASGTSASAATTSRWADWTALTGSGGNYTSSVQISSTPDISAQMNTDSRSGQVGVISGASTWLAQGTPVGAKYGTSRDRPYLNLRPKADTPAGASTTTYTFAQPTPTSNWTFVLGDIDADQVQIRAIGPDGNTLNAAQLGFRGGFNYCAPGVTGKPSCTGSASDVPSWDPATLTLTGNAASQDTEGSAAWFEPSTPVSVLTFVFQRRSGLPVYQTWFASLARDVTGTVSTQSGDGSGVTLTLTDGNGTVVGTTTTGPGGTYAFPGVQASAGYTVYVTAPDGMIVDGATNKPADLSTSDAVVDFAVRDIIPVAVSGTVQDTDGKPISGATVTFPGGSSVVTGPDGSYLFDEVPVGTHQLTVDLPDGYSIVSNPSPIVIDGSSEDPVTNADFIAVALPTLSGTVTTAGTGTPGVHVMVTGPGGYTATTVTNGSGGYEFPGLSSGSYVVSIQSPEGWVPVGPSTRTHAVEGSDVNDVNFELARLGLVSGKVTADGKPIGEAKLTLSGPNDTSTATTNQAGEYDFGHLQPGNYTITATPLPGYRVSGSATRSVILTAAGEVLTGQDFLLATIETPPPPSPRPTPPPPSNEPPNPGQNTGTGRLSDTGTNMSPLLGAGVALFASAAVVLGARWRSRRVTGR